MQCAGRTLLHKPQCLQYLSTHIAERPAASMPVRWASRSGRMPGGSGSSWPRGSAADARDISMRASWDSSATWMTVTSELSPSGPSPSAAAAGSSSGRDSTVGSPGIRPTYLHVDRKSFSSHQWLACHPACQWKPVIVLKAPSRGCLLALQVPNQVWAEECWPAGCNWPPSRFGECRPRRRLPAFGRHCRSGSCCTQVGDRCCRLGAHARLRCHHACLGKAPGPGSRVRHAASGL